MEEMEGVVEVDAAGALEAAGALASELKEFQSKPGIVVEVDAVEALSALGAVAVVADGVVVGIVPKSEAVRKICLGGGEFLEGEWETYQAKRWL